MIQQHKKKAKFRRSRVLILTAAAVILTSIGFATPAYADRDSVTITDNGGDFNIHCIVSDWNSMWAEETANCSNFHEYDLGNGYFRFQSTVDGTCLGVNPDSHVVGSWSCPADVHSDSDPITAWLARYETFGGARYWSQYAENQAWDAQCLDTVDASQGSTSLGLSHCGDWATQVWHAVG